jgi:hypothetical protein
MVLGGRAEGSKEEAINISPLAEPAAFYGIMPA